MQAPPYGCRSHSISTPQAERGDKDDILVFGIDSEHNVNSNELRVYLHMQSSSPRYVPDSPWSYIQEKLRLYTAVKYFVRAVESRGRTL